LETFQNYFGTFRCFQKSVREHSDFWECSETFIFVPKHLDLFRNIQISRVFRKTFRAFETIQSVPDIQICFETFTSFQKVFRNILICLVDCSGTFFKKFVGEHFRMFHWNFLKCSWTFKKFPNMFVNISNQSVEWKNIWEQTQKFSEKSFENY